MSKTSKRAMLLPRGICAWLVVVLLLLLLNGTEASSSQYNSATRGGGVGSLWIRQKRSPLPLHATQQHASSADLSWQEDPPTLPAIVEQTHNLSLDQLFVLLQSSSKRGLTSSEAEDRRLKLYGLNELPRTPPPSLWALLKEQLSDPLVQILVVVAATSALFCYLEDGAGQESSYWEPIVIVVILVVNAFIGMAQSQSATSALAALQELQASTATVLRNNGTMTTIPSAELVPGDLLTVRVGDAVPADGRLVRTSASLTVDEASLTGESMAVAKRCVNSNDDKNEQRSDRIVEQFDTVYAGTTVTRGTAVVLVTHTGVQTELGKIQQGLTSAAASSSKLTPLQEQLQQFGHQLTSLIGGICLAVWLGSVPKFNHFPGGWPRGALYYAKIAVALGVAAIPEGLPAVITLCLSLGTRRMASRNVIVRQLPAVETLGCTTVICTDKTGTLTTNEMTVVRLVTFDTDSRVEEHVVSGYSYAPTGKVDGLDGKVKDGSSLSDIAAVSALCNDAKIVGHDDHKDGKTFERIGEPTEAALCVLTEKLMGCMESNAEKKNSVVASAHVNAWRDTHRRIATLDFNRGRKSMSVLCRHNNENRLYIKGAPNLLLERCNRIKLRNGKVIRLKGRMRRAIEMQLSNMAARPLRCLALAVKDHDNLEGSLRRFKVQPGEDEGTAASRHPLLRDTDNYRNIESGLTLVGIVGIKDPARPEVAKSITNCQKAGIRVIMITGDAYDTAVAIARDVNIFGQDEDESSKAFEGREFFQRSDDEQRSILKEGNLVFCRAEPTDKQQLIKMLQSLSEVTAMTGDGVNDAPALRQASIGLAMGITGTEVSKEAADMVLADDNFSTIVSAVEEGRRIYANMQAFICFLISCNIGEICAIFFATVAGFPEPLTAMHLLWVNLVTDGPPATALGFNPPSPNIMEAAPRPSNEPILTRWLLIRYCVTGLYVGFATIGVFAHHYVSNGISLRQLASWSQCGKKWQPGGEATCARFFQNEGRLRPQTLSLTTLVSMEMIKALSAVSVDSSILTVGPQNNPWLLVGVAIPFLLHLAVLYSAKLGLPFLGESFGMVPLSRSDWANVMAWAAPILIVEEILKAIGRRVERRKRKHQST